MCIHRCKICGEEFWRPQDHTIHLSTRHAISKCDICEKDFNGNFELIQHMLKHLGESFTCGKCGKRFLIKNTHTHMITEHPAENPMKCEVCTNVFTTAKRRDRHGYRSINCAVCKRVFPRVSDLRLHIEKDPVCIPIERFTEKFLIPHNVHVYPKKCHICKESFSSPYDLQLHMWAHTNIKPFQCNDCDFTFLCSSELTAHLMHHCYRQFKCNVCREKLSEDAIYLHIQTHHPGINVDSTSEHAIRILDDQQHDDTVPENEQQNVTLLSESTDVLPASSSARSSASPFQYDYSIPSKDDISPIERSVPNTEGLKTVEYSIANMNDVSPVEYSIPMIDEVKAVDFSIPHNDDRQTDKFQNCQQNTSVSLAFYESDDKISVQYIQRSPSDDSRKRTGEQHMGMNKRSRHDIIGSTIDATENQKTDLLIVKPELGFGHACGECAEQFDVIDDLTRHMKTHTMEFTNHCSQGSSTPIEADAIRRSDGTDGEQSNSLKVSSAYTAVHPEPTLALNVVNNAETEDNNIGYIDNYMTTKTSFLCEGDNVNSTGCSQSGTIKTEDPMFMTDHPVLNQYIDPNQQFCNSSSVVATVKIEQEGDFTVCSSSNQPNISNSNAITTNSGTESQYFNIKTESQDNACLSTESLNIKTETSGNDCLITEYIKTETNVTGFLKTGSPNIIPVPYVEKSVYEYECNMCHAGFHDLDSLNKHRLSHIGAASHQCVLCKKELGLDGEVFQAMHSSRPEYGFICNSCFIIKENFKRQLLQNS